MFQRSIIAAGMLLIVVSMRAAAQSATGVDRPHSIGVAAEWAYPFRGTDPLNGTPGFDATYRAWVQPNVAVELEFGLWRRTYSGTFRLAGYQVPPEHKGEVVYSTYTELYSFYNAGVNVIGRVPIGRVGIIGGGGPGLFVGQQRESSLVNDAVQTSSTRSTHLGVQGLAAMELRLTDRFGAFGGIRAEWRALDTFIRYPIAGARFSF